MQVIFYSLLATPIAFIGLPIYVFLQKIYTDNYGLSLFFVGLTMFLARFVDTIQDPFLGYVSDKLQARNISRKKIIFCSTPLLIISFYFLFIPILPLEASLIVFTILTYTFYSLIIINYYALAYEIAPEYNRQTKLLGGREIFTVIGLCSAVSLPAFLLQENSAEDTYEIITIVLLVLFLMGSFFLSKSKLSSKPTEVENSKVTFSFKKIFAIILDVRRKNFFLALLLGATAASIPATIILFYVKHILVLEDQTPFFLLTYFLSAIIFMPFWVILSAKIGKKKTWLTSIIIASVSFLFTLGLGQGDATAFYVICLVTGGCFGADLAIPASIFADLIDGEKNNGLFYSILNFINKLSLAFGALIGLMIPYYFGFDPAENSALITNATALLSLKIVYGLIPAILKIFSGVLLYKSNIDNKFKDK